MRVFLFPMIVLLLSACSSVSPGETEALTASPNDIQYFPEVLRSNSADNISFFGVMLGDNESKITSVHGDPDRIRSYSFGTISNYEYFFDTNRTIVLYHTEDGYVTSVLLPDQAALVLNYTYPLTVQQLYSYFGQPSSIRETENYRLYVYNSLGVEAYHANGGIDRLYFRAPTPEEPKRFEGENTFCLDEPTAAINRDGECFTLTQGCINTEYWNIVGSCPNNDINSAPSICIESPVYAINEINESCKEFASICDIPSGWNEVTSC